MGWSYKEVKVTQVLIGAEVTVKVSTLGSGRAQRTLVRAERMWVIEKNGLRTHDFSL